MIRRWGLHIALCVVLALFTAGLAPWAAADAILEVNAHSDKVDMTSFGSPIAAERQSISVQGPGDAAATTLMAQGPGPAYFWTLYSLHNADLRDLDFIVAVSPNRFPGSGLLKIAAPGPQALGAVITGGTVIVPLEHFYGADGFPLHLKAGASVNLAIETRSAVAETFLTRRDALTQPAPEQAFYSGLTFGIMVLVVSGILFIYGYRPNRAVLAGWFFAIGALGFTALESDIALLPSGIVPTLHGAVESLWAAALALCVVVFARLRKASPIAFFGVLVVAGLLVANAAYAVPEPLIAMTVARFSFAALVVCGFVATLGVRGRDRSVVDRGLVLWSLLGGFVLLGGIISQQKGRDPVFSAALTGFLAVVLVALALTLLRHVFRQGLAAKPFITDQSRRSLALAGAGHVMWDFMPGAGALDLSDELPRVLGYRAEGWEGNGLSLFKSIMHPFDLKAYEIDVEQVPRRPGTYLARELRLRDAEGRYRWFQLKAKAVPGVDLATERLIGTLTEITEDKMAQERMVADAIIDPVTELPNRSLFLDRLTRELDKPITLPMRVLALEIDRFKALNDALGREVGDRILQTVASRITALLQGDETVARLSGGQFAIIAVEAIDRRDALSLGKQLVDALAQPILLPQHPVVVACAVGISATGLHQADATELLQQAQAAMLEAERLTGIKIAVFDTAMKDERAEQLVMEADLRQALTRDEIDVHFQPIARLSTLEIAGYEALARWRHPRFGLLAPAQFIDLAERIGVIGELGAIVLAGAARQLGVWQRVLLPNQDFFVSVNISVSHVLQKNFLQQVQTVVEREGLRAHSLKIEITESVLMRQPERAKYILEQLQSLGVGLACDDFGTGFSSLASIRDLPFDTLKLDRTFIAPSGLDQRSEHVIAGIAEMAHGLGMTVVAEGIEAQDQLDRLAELGCDLGQGFLIGMAVEAKDVSNHLAVLPRYAPRVPQPDSQKPPPGSAPLAPRRVFRLDPAEPLGEPDVLPSIFSVKPVAPKPEVKKKLGKKKPSKKAKPKYKGS